MATRKGINVSGNYAAPHYIECPVHICTLYLKKLIGRTKPYFTFFLKLNDHPTRCFNFELSRIHPNGCICSNLIFKNSTLKQNLSKNQNKAMKGLFSHLNFRPLRSSPIH